MNDILKFPKRKPVLVNFMLIMQYSDGSYEHETNLIDDDECIDFLEDFLECPE